MRVDIPPNATPIRTPVVFKDPSFVCFDHGNGKTADGGCDDCAKLKRAPSDANIAAYAAVVTARQADVMKAQHALNNAIQTRNNLQAIKPNSTELAAAIQEVRAAEDGVNQANAALVQAQATVTSAKAQAAPSECECKQRWVVDIHVASSNGISNHLLVEVPEPGPAAARRQADDRHRDDIRETECRGRLGHDDNELSDLGSRHPAARHILPDQRSVPDGCDFRLPGGNDDQRATGCGRPGAVRRAQGRSGRRRTRGCSHRPPLGPGPKPAVRPVPAPPSIPT